LEEGVLWPWPGGNGLVSPPLSLSSSSSSLCSIDANAIAASAHPEGGSELKLRNEGGLDEDEEGFVNPGDGVGAVTFTTGAVGAWGCVVCVHERVEAGSCSLCACGGALVVDDAGIGDDNSCC